jgi:predicted P-loop ATPase
VKRITEPGCKFDYVLVLEGEQGTKKSTSLYILGGNWHVETAMSTDSKDFFMQFAGKAIVEFSEGETLSRTEVKRMKAIITMQTDKYRPPYERNSQEFPRRCVFAMTTNQTEYLKDETGNRRWLPVTVALPEANVEWLAANREQLFAEAYHRVANLKETTYDFPKEEMLEAQEKRRIQDANTDLVTDWYFNTLTNTDRREGITVQQVFKAINGGWAGKPMNKYDEMTIGTLLKKTLKLTNERVSVGGARCTKWFDRTGRVIEQEVLEDGNAVLSSNRW